MSDKRVTIINWLSQLKSLTRPTSEPITREKLAGYVAMLFADFDDAAFTRESLREAAGEFEFFPAYSVLKAFLRDRMESALEQNRRLPGATSGSGQVSRFLPKWLHEKILSQGDPGPMLGSWLETRNIEQ